MSLLTSDVRFQKLHTQKRTRIQDIKSSSMHALWKIYLMNIKGKKQGCLHSKERITMLNSLDAC